jgi:hypothetical protein
MHLFFIGFLVGVVVTAFFAVAVTGLAMLEEETHGPPD